MSSSVLKQILNQNKDKGSAFPPVDDSQYLYDAHSLIDQIESSSTGSTPIKAVLRHIFDEDTRVNKLLEERTGITGLHAFIQRHTELLQGSRLSSSGNKIINGDADDYWIEFCTKEIIPRLVSSYLETNSGFKRNFKGHIEVLGSKFKVEINESDNELITLFRFLYLLRCMDTIEPIYNTNLILIKANENKKIVIRSLKKQLRLTVIIKMTQWLEKAEDNKVFIAFGTFIRIGIKLVKWYIEVTANIGN